MVRGIRRLIDDIRNPKASKKRRKKRIDTIQDLPRLPGFKGRPLLKISKHLAKILVDVGPEGGKARLFDEPPPPIITRHTQEQLDFEANLVRWKPTTPHPNAKPIRGPPQEMIRMTRKEEDDLQRELQDLFDQLPTEGEQELAYLTLREENERGAQNQTLENALARMGADRPRQFQTTSPSRQFSRFNLMPRPKKKRKVSAYSREFGKQLKRLKKLHPRTKIQNLMKKAHRRTRAAMK